jgi:hypothetical protein
MNFLKTTITLVTATFLQLLLFRNLLKLPKMPICMRELSLKCLVFRSRLFRQIRY